MAKISMSDVAFYEERKVTDDMAKISMSDEKEKKVTDADMAKISIIDIALCKERKVTDVDMVLIH